MDVILHGAVNEEIGVPPAWPDLLIGDPSLQFGTQVEEYLEENTPEDLPLVWPLEQVWSTEPQPTSLNAVEFMHYVPPISAERLVSFGVEERAEPLKIEWDLWAGLVRSTSSIGSGRGRGALLGSLVRGCPGAGVGAARGHRPGYGRLVASSRASH